MATQKVLPVEDPPKLRRDAASNRERLVLAASDVFSRRGLEGGVDEIARVAGVGMGTFYRHFPTKDLLIAELVDQLLTEVLEIAQSALDEPNGSGLESCIRAVYELQASHRGCQLRLWARHGEPARIERVRSVLQALLVDAQRLGTIRRDVVLEDISLMLLSIGLVIEKSTGVSATAWERLLELMLAGLSPKAPPFESTALTRAELKALQGATEVR